MTKWYGYNPPFFGGHQQVLSKQSGDRIIKNDIIQLIMTSVDERVMRPGYGTLTRRYLFEQLDSNVINALQQNIQATLNKYESRVKLQVTVSEVEDKNALNVNISGYYTYDPQSTIDFSFEIRGPKE